MAMTTKERKALAAATAEVSRLKDQARTWEQKLAESETTVRDLRREIAASSTRLSRAWDYLKSIGT